MPSIELHQLKTYVLSNFSKKSGCYTTLIEVFINNKLYYNIMLKMDMIASEADVFLTAEEKPLRDIMQISDRKVQKQKCEELVDAYVKKKILREVKKPSVPQNSPQQPVPKDKMTGAKKPSDSVPPTQKPIKKQVREKPPKLKGTFYCVNDLCELKRIDTFYVRNKETNAKVAFPQLKCPQCNRFYTVLKKGKDLAPIKLEGVRYTNLTAAMNQQRVQSTRRLQGRCNCCICERNMPARCIKCYGKLQTVTVLLKKKKRKQQKQTVCALPYCSRCGVYYIKDRSIYSEYQSLWNAVGKPELRKAAEKIDNETKEQLVLQAERNLQKQTQELLHGQHTMQERKISVLPVNAKRQEPQERKDGAENQITLQDFVVRRTTFRCLHQQHELKNIDAEVGIIDRYGDISSTKVSAGYCKNCNLFFIMESTYQNLKMKGTPMCRISDEKTYMSGGIAENGMKLSQESILMQYGYSVSQMEGLSDSRRQKILAVLVDNKILTRSDIIGYLDFFINQRKHQHKYEKAIEKWENDREFVSRYRTGSYTEYKINSIRRKY